MECADSVSAVHGVCGQCVSTVQRECAEQVVSTFLLPLLGPTVSTLFSSSISTRSELGPLSSHFCCKERNSETTVSEQAQKQENY